jgi:RHH-type proline utilization regulon transcriptional repressor/proline dehydrogenase/delta 1-pyrroline-5-carboxylate dehydrogenase
VDSTQGIDLPLAHEAIAQVQTWLEQARYEPVDRAARDLAGLLQDPRGLDFATGFVDQVVRPEDPRVAARAFRELSRRPPGFLSPQLRALVRLGGSVAPVAPRLVVPLARRALREMVRHLVVDATDARLGPALARIRAGGARLNVNLLGEAVLGSSEAERRVAGTIRLIERDDVDYVSIKVSSTVAPHSPWAHDRAVDDAVAALTPVYRAARDHDTFVNLDMEEYRDLDLTLDVFQTLLDLPEFADVRAGIVLQAYLPDSLAAMMRIQEWAATRAGTPVKVRVVKGANLPMERVDAEIHGWPLATWPDKARTDANYKKILDYALTPERSRFVHVGVAGHNLFDGVEFEMLLGMAAGQAAVVGRDGGGLRLYTPVVHPDEFDVAIAYLVRRLEEGASAENFMSAAFDLDDSRLFERERDRFLASIALIPSEVPHPNRTMDRAADPLGALARAASAGGLAVAEAANPSVREESGVDPATAGAWVGEGSDTAPAAGGVRRGDGAAAESSVCDESLMDPASAGTRRGNDVAGEYPDTGPAPSGRSMSARTPFRNAPDTDPSLAANRAWAAGIRARMATSTAGKAATEAATIRSAEELDAAIAEAAASGWGSRPAVERARILRAAGDEIERRRAELIEVMGFECGKVIEQSDPEVSEAADFARFYADGAERLDEIDGARFEPVGVTAVIPPWNFPAAIPAGGVLAALAAGSAVVFKPARQAARTGAVIAEALWAAGVPRDALRLVSLTPAPATDAGDRGERLDTARQADEPRTSHPDEDALPTSDGAHPGVVRPEQRADAGSREREAPNLGSRLVADPRIERVILTGSYETAERFRRIRPALPLLAETSGKNAIIVTPSADLDLAAHDVAYSAFGHAGQKCSAASLVVLVGSVADSDRFRRQLLDAVGSYRVGDPWDEAARIGPLIAPAEGKLLRALTTLEPGQSWLLEPRRIGDATWTPGIRLGVHPGSEFHTTEYFGPVLGIMTAASLDEAIDIVNAVDYGLTSGLHSLDEDEIDRWLSRVEAGNAYVNRGITGAIVARQPFGGWKKSSVGPGTKAGGPNYLFALGTWHDADPVGRATTASPEPGAVADPRADAESPSVTRPRADAADPLADVSDAEPLTAADRRADGGAPALTPRIPAAAAPDAFAAAHRLIRRAADPAHRGWLEQALASDEIAYADEFGVARDAQALSVEQNALRYVPTPAIVRFEGVREADLLRVVSAALRVGAPIDVSTASLPSEPVRELFITAGIAYRVEDDARWEARVARLGEARIRLIGGSADPIVRASDGSPRIAVWAGEVTRSGRIEALPFLREQAVSITAHRFGTPRRYEVPAG